ncbi:MAG: glycosyltransferase [Chitinophagales bacterium]
MQDPPNYFNGVTLFVTHYNRSNSLERLLLSFREKDIQFESIVISDDASSDEHLEKITDLQKDFKFQLIRAAKNGGLGNNLNKGQEAITTPFTLYVQEDFTPTDAFSKHFADAIQIMQEDPEWDIIRFYAYLRYPYLKPYKRGFSEMVFKFWYYNYYKLYCYSDHPHLRRSNFLQKFGKYREGYNPPRTEYWMCVSFVHHKGRGLFFEDYQSLFHHHNTNDEPSTWDQKKWIQNSENILIRFSRDMYRRIRYNLDILMFK